MVPYRKITLTAKNDRGVFAESCHASGEWVVLSLDDTAEFELGHVIAGCLDCSDGWGYSRAVQNENVGCSVRVCIENWGLRWDDALSLKPSIRAKQAHFTNQKSTTFNRQSKQRSVAAHQ
jgi:hypothetical protein